MACGTERHEVSVTRGPRSDLGYRIDRGLLQRRDRYGRVPGKGSSGVDVH